MTTLITGGTGKTGSILARLLHAAGKPFLIASRTGKAPEPFKAVKFDWFDATTFEDPFKLSADVDRVYLIIPLVLDPLPVMKPFIDLAVSKGVKRFIFMSTSSTNAGDELHGKVHQYLLDIGVGYGVLRPTGFMENFGQHPWFVKTIKESSELVSAYQDGRIPYVACEDIAQAAFEMLTAGESPNKDIYVLGPTLYSNDEALALLSSVLGREIKHRRNTVAEQEEFYKTKFAFPPELAKVLSQRDKQIADGFQESLVNEPEDKKFIGKKTLLQYFQENSELWTK
ncbi:hypothetical protein D9613_008440 [Agrocybe pediades]|uniref:Agroclavine dehydrogenase n=1 Tax=Agrocybe pediades TaxID=84607 RepID=A0A8H4VP17_9AGAR|nr:hypothetical protein D9613_008440 [Agrocybe pediades]